MATLQSAIAELREVPADYVVVIPTGLTVGVACFGSLEESRTPALGLLTWLEDLAVRHPLTTYIVGSYHILGGKR